MQHLREERCCFAARFYDALGRLSTLKDGDDNPIVAYRYDAAGRLAENAHGNGTYTVYEYDRAGNLLTITNHGPRPGEDQAGPINSEFAYTYDALGHVIRQITPDGEWRYGYDAAGQVTRAVFTPNANSTLLAQDLQYSYDAAGNRTQSVINGVTTDYAVNARNEYTQIGDTAYTYDADGNLTTATTGGATTTYAFDQLSHLTGISTSTDVWSYQYDVFGNRNVSTHNGQTTRFQIDPIGLGNPSAQFDGAGNLIAHYTYGLGLVSQVGAGGAAGYYDFDLTGNTVSITGAAGTSVNKYAYLPFGAIAASSGSLVNPFTFVGQEGVWSDGSGLLGMRARNYDPTTGQFISNDPLNLVAGDTNVRRYVGNNPVSFVDPSGLCESNSWEEYEPYIVAGLAIGGLFTLGIGALLASEAVIIGGAGLVAAGSFLDAFSLLTSEYGPLASVKNGVGAFVDSLKPLSANSGLNQQKAQINHELAQAYNRAIAHGYQGPAPSYFPVKPSGCTCEPLNDNAPHFDGKHGPGGKTGKVKALDPNQLIGPAGFGASNWVAAGQTLSYAVEFENMASATAAAQDVVVTQQLDGDLDWSTFQLGDLQFGATIIRVPAGLQSFSSNVPATNLDGTPLGVNISAVLNRDTGMVTWTFRSVDPVTGLPPENPVAGFLPPNDATQRGTGFVHYTVRARAGVGTGTQIRGVANIVFDTNDPIATNQVDPLNAAAGTDPNKEGLVTIDASAPSSSVTPLPVPTGAPSFILSWGGADDAGGSGIATYDIFFSTDGGVFQPLLQGTTATATVFRGTPGHTYAFYSVATDNVGNRTAVPAPAQFSTQLVVANTSTKLKAPASARVGQPVKLTATVKKLPGVFGKLKGAVTFVAGDTILGTASLKTVNGVARATFSTTSLNVGLYSVEAIYGGNGALITSTAAPRSVHLLSPTITTVTSSSPTAPFGTAVIFTGTVTAVAQGAGVPGGTVSFFDTFGGVRRLLATVDVDPVSGEATITEANLRQGSHRISARYAPLPGADFEPSKSAAIEELIQGPSFHSLSRRALDAQDFLFAHFSEGKDRAWFAPWEDS